MYLDLGSRNSLPHSELPCLLKGTFRYIVYKINPHKWNLCSHVGNLTQTQSGMWMWLISSLHFASQASKTSHPGNSKPSQTVTLNKAVFLKYGFRMKLWYTKWGDIDLAFDPTGPQTIDKMKVLWCWIAQEQSDSTMSLSYGCLPFIVVCPHYLFARIWYFSRSQFIEVSLSITVKEFCKT